MKTTFCQCYLFLRLRKVRVLIATFNSKIFLIFNVTVKVYNAYVLQIDLFIQPHWFLPIITACYGVDDSYLVTTGWIWIDRRESKRTGGKVNYNTLKEYAAYKR